MHEQVESDLARLVDDLLTCPMTQRGAWLGVHRSQLSISMIEELKRRTDQSLRSDANLAQRASACALLVAEHLPGDPQAAALAHWARGNWASYNAPNDAIAHYRHALVGYRRANQPLAVARLLANLVAPLAESGAFAESDAAYREAHDILHRLGPDAAFYQLSLEQNYGWLLHHRGQYDDALVVHARALELAQRFDQADRIAEVQVNRTLTLAMLGRLAEGEAALLHSRSVAEAHAQAMTVARIDMDLGELAAALGRPAEALRWFQAARAGFAAQDNVMELGSVLMREAELFEQLGLWREARRGYQRAEVVFQRLELWPEVGRALLRAAGAARREGRSTRQIARLLDAAAALWHKLNQPFWQAAITIERARGALATGDLQTGGDLLATVSLENTAHALAIQCTLLRGEFARQHWEQTREHAHRVDADRAFTTVLAYAEQQQHNGMQRQALAGLGKLALPDNPTHGRAFFERAIAIDERMRQALSVEELKASFTAQASDLLPLLAHSALVQRQPLQALHDMWRAKGGALRDLLRATAADRQAAPAVDAEIARVRQQLAAERWRRAREQTDALAEEPQVSQNSVVAALEEQLLELRRHRNQAAAPLHNHGSPDSITQQLVTMPADVLIEYLRCDDRLLAICADRQGMCRGVIIDDLDGILDLLDLLDLSMHNVVTQPSPTRRAANGAPWMEEIRPILQELYTRLIAPFGVLPDHGRLLLAPCDPITLVPFAALLDGDQYLGQRFTVEMTPSGALLVVPPPNATQPLGPPLIIAASAEGRLTSIAAEANAICDVLPSSTCLVDDPNTLAYLTTVDTAPALLHIAAHTLLRADIPIFSALQLAGGTLTVEQCYELSLTGTALVTLSGCVTASGLDSGGALLAFQSAFFVAGAQRVVSSLWPVDDDATAHCMGMFYRLLADGHAPQIALQRAQQELLTQPGYEHPAIWAAFTCSRR